MLGRPHDGRNMSLSSDCLDPSSSSRSESGLNLELQLGNAPGKPPAKNSAHAGRVARSSDVDWGMLSKGIVVTKEVSVTYTEEERIQRVIGF